MAHKAQNVHSLAPYRKSLLTPVIHYGSFIPLAAGGAKRSAIPAGGCFLVYNCIEEKGEWILTDG